MNIKYNLLQYTSFRDLSAGGIKMYRMLKLITYDCFVIWKWRFLNSRHFEI